MSQPPAQQPTKSAPPTAAPAALDGKRDPINWVSSELASMRDQGLFNTIRVIQSPCGPWMDVDGRRVLNLTTNNYLGLANDPELRAAAQSAIERWGVGPAAVRSIAGTLGIHVELERAIASFKGVEDALFVQSGFCANQAAIPPLVGKEDVVYTDRLNHASIIDGCRLAGAKIIIYEHCDAADAAAKMREHTPQYRRALLVTDGVFSMDGDIAPLDALWKSANENGVMTMVDDAHGEGVLGRAGRGIVDHFGLHGKVDCEVGTFSKAFGVVGGAIAGRRELVDFIRQRARPFLFSSATPPADTAACLAAIQMLARSGERVERLWKNARYFQERMRKAGFDTGKTQTPITPVILGENKTAQTFSRKLFEKGVFAVPIVFPTVPKGSARIRVMVSAGHTSQDLDQGIEAFAAVGKELGVI
ncbi:MAG: glycine C-acetyltransferase [Thermoplasmatota archaeon]